MAMFIIAIFCFVILRFTVSVPKLVFALSSNNIDADPRVVVSLPIVFVFFGLFGSQNALAVINADVQASRANGVAPLAVFFDATGTTSTATSRPFHEVHYEWNFGDPTAGDWPHGNPNNRNKNKARGPVTAHVFETPGTYRVTLTTTEMTGAADTESVTITVQDPDVVFSGANTVCFSTSGNFTGCPSGAHQVTTSNVGLIDSNISPGKRLLLRRGETWSNGSLEIYSNGPGTIGAFGTGAKPELDNIGIDVAPGTSPVSGEPGTRDWRVMDLEFISTQGRAISSEGEFENLLLLRLRMRQASRQAVFFPGSKLGYYNESRGQQHEAHNGVFVVEIDSVDSASYAEGMRYAVLGCSWDGTDYEHVNRYPYMEKGVIAHNYYTRAEDSVRHLIKLHAPSWGGDALYPAETESGEIVISDNHFHGTIEDWSLSLGPQSPRDYANEHVVDIIVERNLFTGENGAPQTHLHTAGYNITVRNNIFNLSNSAPSANAASVSTRNSGQPPVSGFWFYNNNVYRQDARVEGVFITASDTKIYNNIVYSPEGNSTLGCPNGASSCLNNLVDEDPLWSNPVGGDFSLRPNSPAIDSGIAAPVFADFANTSRPQGSGFDVGAYERQSATSYLSAPTDLRVVEQPE